MSELAEQLSAPPEPQQPTEKPAARPPGHEGRGAIAEWTVTILLLLFLTSFLVQAFVIPSGSMEDTLLIGDHVLVDKLAYAPAGVVSRVLLPYRAPRHGDIIVFRYPVDISENFVKRVIGEPGDRIRIVNKIVYRNGVRLDEPYAYHKTDFIEPYRDNFPGDPTTSLGEPARSMLQDHVVNGEVVVPTDRYFAMGDNRDFSLDSRYWGFVPRENIIGKPLLIYWSYASPSDQLAEQSFDVRHIVDVGEHFFTRTRWKRTLMLIHGYHKD